MEENPSESLTLIENYLLKQRENFRHQSKGIILWGWLVLVACILHFILLRFVKWDEAFLPWPVLMISGVIVSVINSINQRRKQGYQTFSDNSIRSVSIGAMLLYFTVTFLCVYQDIPPMPYMLLITSMLLGTIGGILKFRFLVLGSIIFLVAGITSVFFDEATQLLIAAPAIILGYIVPGYSLRKNN